MWIVWVAFSLKDVRERAVLLAAVFALFFGLSLHRHFQGFQSCGCVGFLEIKPLYSSLCSLFISISFLTLISKSSEKFVLVGNELRLFLSDNVVPTIAFALVFSAVAFLQTTQSFVASDDVAMDDVQLGNVQGGERIDLFLYLKNQSRNPVTVLGIKASCSCIGTGDVVQTVDSGEVTAIPISIRPNKLGAFHHQVRCYLSGASTRHVRASVYGQVSLPQ